MTRLVVKGKHAYNSLIAAPLKSEIINFLIKIKMSQLIGKNSYSKNPNLMLSGSSNPNRQVVNSTVSPAKMVKVRTLKQKKIHYFLRKNKLEKRVSLSCKFLDNHTKTMVQTYGSLAPSGHKDTGGNQTIPL